MVAISGLLYRRCKEIGGEPVLIGYRTGGREEEGPQGTRHVVEEEKRGDRAPGGGGPLGEKAVKPEQFQLIAIAIGPVATLVVVFLGVLFQNRHVDTRISDLTRAMDQKFTDTKDLLRAEMRADFAELRALIERNHSEILAKFAEFDSRLSRLEGERRIVQ
jgi:hypothetical protein